MRILVVDDDKSIVAALTILLEKDGHQVLSHTNPLNAAQVTDRFDAVISDFSMPSIDGVQLLTRLRDSHPEARRFMMTAYANSATVAAARESGLVEHVFVKPWRIDDIRTALR